MKLPASALLNTWSPRESPKDVKIPMHRIPIWELYRKDRAIFFKIPERFPQGLVTGHRRQEDHCQRVYDGRGEHDKGQGHSCEDTIDA